MQLQGTIIASLPTMSGENAKGKWVTKDYVVETHEEYPKRMVFTIFGEERIQRLNLQKGMEVCVFFNIDAREHNGRWFNSITAFDVRPVQTNQNPPF